MVVPVPQIAPAHVFDDTIPEYTGVGMYDLFILQFGHLEEVEKHEQGRPFIPCYSKLVACSTGCSINIDALENVMHLGSCFGGVLLATRLSARWAAYCLRMEDTVRRNKHNPSASMEPQVVLTEEDARRAYEYRVNPVLDALVNLQRAGMRFPSNNLYWDVATRLRLTAKLSKKTGMPETISLHGRLLTRIDEETFEKWFFVKRERGDLPPPRFVRAQNRRS